MTKRDMEAIQKAYIKIHCPHIRWKNVGVFRYGNFTADVVECKECGKSKLLFDLKEGELLE